VAEKVQILTHDENVTLGRRQLRPTWNGTRHAIPCCRASRLGAISWPHV